MTTVFMKDEEWFPSFEPTEAEIWASDMSVRVQREKLYRDVGKAVKAIPRLKEAGRAIVGEPRPGDKTTGVPHPVEMETFEHIYKKVPAVFQAVNKTADHVMQGGFRIIGENKANVDLVKEWMDYIGFHPLCHELVRNVMIWGNCYHEVVENKSKRGKKVDPTDWKIVELKPLNPDTIQVYRYETGQVIGYIQRPKSRRWIRDKTRLPDRKRSTGKKRKSWKKEVKDAYDDAVVFDAEDIIHHKFNQMPSAEYGISPMEPIKSTLATYIGVMGDVSAIIRRYGSPKVIWSIGNQDRPPSRRMVDDFHSSMAALNVGDDVVVPGIVEWQVLDAGLKVMDMEPFIQFIRNDLFTGLGVSELIMGGNVQSALGAAEIALEAFSRRIIEIQKFLEVSFRKNVFGRVLGMGIAPFSRMQWKQIPKLIFNPPETVEKIALREISLHTAGLKSTEEVRDTLGFSPPLPEGETGVDLQIKLAKFKATMPNANRPGTRGPAQSTGGGSDDKTAKQQPKGQQPAKHK
jgi:hypothetical protein